MSLILGKYKKIKRLGRGAYGEVILVQNDKGEKYALKLIGLKHMIKQPYLMDYLEGQIECMRTMGGPYIMKLIDSQEDQKYKYLLCEYCEGGDLLGLQLKQQNQVFSLERAKQILSEVIMGLELLHKEQYLHRDIKSQNILIKIENGKQEFKLADFGFSKKIDRVEGTMLGTQLYMSPEIYRNDSYGFQVDMWAFGVLFFFMLNKQYPFKLNPFYQIQRKQIELMKMAKNFSYKKAVVNTTKKIMVNCTPEIQDLFSKIFQIDADQRISFYQIRKHPVFKKYFPSDQTKSQILYGKKYDSKIISKQKLENVISILKKTSSPTNKSQLIPILQEDAQRFHSKIQILNKQFPKEKACIENQKQKLQFLYESKNEFINAQYLPAPQRHSLSFNLIKYYIILMRQFLKLLNCNNLEAKYPNLNWKTYCKIEEFNFFVKEIVQGLQKAELQFQNIYQCCFYIMSDIRKINVQFQTNFEKQITDTTFAQGFKESYRKSTHLTFKSLQACVKQNNNKKFNYGLTIVAICHVFNRIFENTQFQNTLNIFSDYFNEKKSNEKQIYYSQLREWMTLASIEQLNNIVKRILKVYFSN